jgi:hypothetical protein
MNLNLHLLRFNVFFLVYFFIRFIAAPVIPNLFLFTAGNINLV